MNTRNSINAIIVCLLIFPLAAFAWGAPTSPDKAPRNRVDIREMGHDAPMAKILPVLECKITDHKLLGKAKEKLASMDNNDIDLIASLCERISGHKDDPSGDIAFFLVAALIVLS